MSATPGAVRAARVDAGRRADRPARPASSTPRSRSGPTKGQVDDLIEEIRKRTENEQRVLVTTLTKKMAEDLTDYLPSWASACATCTPRSTPSQRIEILRDLRLGEFDVLVGINLLREGLDLPEVSLVAILDADKEGFLRSRDLADPDDRAGRAQRRRARCSCTPTRSPTP